MGNEKFCLRWNDFETNISLAFRELKDDKDFFDVTLACDGEQISAHKIILSACSPFFRDILRRNPHQHPLLYFKGIKLPDMQAVLNFMYHGEVSVAQEELNTFLAVAEDLRVKGLTQNNSEDIQNSKPIKDKPQQIASDFPARQSWQTPPPAKSRQPTTTQEDDDIQEVVPVKAEPRDVPPSAAGSLAMANQELYPSPASQTVAAVNDPAYDYHADEYDDYGQYEGNHYQGGGEAAMEGSKDVDSLMSKLDTGYLCLVCNRVSAAKGNMKKHIESVHIQEEPQQCGLCERKFKNKNSLQNHMSLSHRKI